MFSLLPHAVHVPARHSFLISSHGQISLILQGTQVRRYFLHGVHQADLLLQLGQEPLLDSRVTRPSTILQLTLSLCTRDTHRHSRHGINTRGVRYLEKEGEKLV